MTPVHRSACLPRSVLEGSLGLMIMLLFGAGFGIAGFQAPSKATGTEATEENKAQPIPFSHKVHSRFLQSCSFCHVWAESSSGYPEEAKCMQCHTAVKTESPYIKELAEYAREKKQVPWVPV